jgi:hypothetical protein
MMVQRLVWPAWGVLELFWSLAFGGILKFWWALQPAADNLVSCATTGAFSVVFHYWGMKNYFIQDSILINMKHVFVIEIQSALC